MKRKEQIKRIIQDLKKFASTHPDWVILVEGKRDYDALLRLGVMNVMQMRGMGYHDLIQNISEGYSGVILLMDFDFHGERIFQKLSGLLRVYGLKVDTSFRERLKRAGIMYVEEIPEALGLQRW